MAEYLKENAVAVPEGNKDVLGPCYCLPHTVCYRTPSGEGKESRLIGTMATDTAAEPEGQPTTVAVAPVKERKSKTKSILIGGDEEEAGSGGAPIDLAALMLGNCGQRCTLDGSEAKQLGSLSQDAGIDQGIRKRPETCSLCRQFLSIVRERYSCKDELLVCHKAWNMAQGVWYLRESAVLEMIFSDNEQFPNNPDSIQCI